MEDDQKIVDVTETTENAPEPMVQQQNIVDEPVHHKNATVVLIAVFVLLLAVIAGLSYLLLQEDETTTELSQDIPSQTEETVPVENDASTETESAAAIEPISNNWLLVETTDYSIKVPDGWDVTLQDNGVLLLDCSDLGCYDIEDGQPAVVTEVLGGRDGLTGLLVTVQSAGYSENDLTPGYEFLGLVGENNRFSRYQKTYDNEPTGEGLGEQPQGTVANIIVDTLFDERVAYLSYDVIVGQSDPIDTIIEMLNTFTPTDNNTTL